ncbi:MAG TPA: GNAT family N-acetyltransferase, partial [Solirubrobacterales bacterium]|nr:GNAT family N-acetyltransferase [Solirubrobacterales bacterium]
IDFSPTGLVSCFLRHRLGSKPPLAGSTERNTVQIADPELPPKSRASDRQQIRRNEREGMAVRHVPGPDATAAERAAFHAAYTQTMHRTEAAPRYFFAPEYFETILASRLTWLFMAETAAGELAATSIATRSDGMLHYYLSGTADGHLRGAPMKNLLAAMCEFAAEQGLPLNLGGGITPGDRLEEFKRGFANRTEALHTSELICDRAAYDRLAAAHTLGGYFPAYRAP